MMTSGHRLQTTDMSVDFEMCFRSFIGKFGIFFNHLSIDPKIQRIFLQHRPTILPVDIEDPRATDFRPVFREFLERFPIHFQRIFVVESATLLNANDALMTTNLKRFGTLKFQKPTSAKHFFFINTNYSYTCDCPTRRKRDEHGTSDRQALRNLLFEVNRVSTTCKSHIPACHATTHWAKLTMSSLKKTCVRSFSLSFLASGIDDLVTMVTRRQIDRRCRQRTRGSLVDLSQRS